jgi:hypothetical protein
MGNTPKIAIHTWGRDILEVSQHFQARLTFQHPKVSGLREQLVEPVQLALRPQAPARPWAGPVPLRVRRERDLDKNLEEKHRKAASRVSLRCGNPIPLNLERNIQQTPKTSWFSQLLSCVGLAQAILELDTCQVAK